MTIAVARNGRWWQSSLPPSPVTGRRSDESLPDEVRARLLTESDAGRHTSEPDATVSEPPLDTADLDSSLKKAGPVAVGVLGFEPDSPAVFHVTRGADFTAVPVASALPAVLSSREEPSSHDYAKIVAQALDALDSGAPDSGSDGTASRLRKVVLGRWLRISTESAVSPADLAASLAQHNHNSTVMAVPLGGADSDAASTLVTASPELLLARRGPSILSRPLAGSAVRASDPVEDRRRADALLLDEKNLHEHALVVEAIRDALGPLCTQLQAPTRPSLVGTSAMWHLATAISGTLRADIADHWSALHLAQLLHPTPAVAGTPRSDAMRLISELELEPRGPMTGAAGWVNAVGDGEFHVVIRAALVAGTATQLFAGAGIVPGSVPVDEATETGAKLSTVLRAFGG
ncbi:isochorismate synthase [Micrococcales bacterium KH10]|nr:isochorismate synthase [Micrococcales bacterium KH10]